MQKKEVVADKVRQLKHLSYKVDEGKIDTKEDKEITIAKLEGAMAALRWSMLPQPERISKDEFVVVFVGMRPQTPRGERLAMEYTQASFVQRYVEANTDMMSDFLEWIFLKTPYVRQETAYRVAEQLDRLIKEGHTANAEKKFLEDVGPLRYRKCGTCAGQGSLIDPQCGVCGGSGVVDIYRDGCELSVEAIKKFSGFCRDSGGYLITHRRRELT